MPNLRNAYDRIHWKLLTVSLVSILGLLIANGSQAMASPVVTPYAVSNGSSVLSGGSHAEVLSVSGTRDHADCEMRTSIGVFRNPHNHHQHEVGGYASVVGCVGSPLPTECSARAVLYDHPTGGPGSKQGWHFVKDGPKVHSCHGEHSTVTLKCHSYPYLVDYRTTGEYTFTWEGKVYPDFTYSHVEAVDGLCS